MQRPAIRNAVRTAWIIALFQVFTGLIVQPLSAQQFGTPTNFSNSYNSDLYNSMPAWQNGNWLNSSLTPAQDWKLGVQVDDLDTGVYIRQVAPGSAAARATLEVGDVIIAVGGQQVGMVEGRYVDFSSEIRRKADSNGNVGLLVQDAQTGRLAAIRVQLDGNQTAVRGYITRRDRSSLPPDATITVTLTNITRPFYEVRNGQITFLASAQNNIPFEIRYDPRYIDANDQYEIKATVVSSNRVIYQTSRGTRVFGGAPSDGIQLEVVPTQSTSAYPANWPVVTAGYGSPISESLANQVTQIYRRYLGRDPYSTEVLAFASSPDPQTELRNLPLTLLAGQQYYDAVGNNNTMWVTAVFQQIIGRPPTNQERDQWLVYLSQLRNSRVELLRELVRQKK